MSIYQYFFDFTLILGFVRSLDLQTSYDYLQAGVKLQRMGKKFLDEKFVPMVFDQTPNITALVKFNKVNLKGGTVLTREEVLDPPKIKYCGDTENFHTVVMARPVIPKDGDPNKYQEYDHWIVGNIPGSKMHKGDVILPYYIPPKDNEDLYPYVIAIFEQSDNLNFNNEIYNDTLKTVPGSVRLKQFISKYDLVGPVRANYFVLC